jgi:hypothetical protein
VILGGRCRTRRYRARVGAQRNTATSVTGTRDRALADLAPRVQHLGHVSRHVLRRCAMWLRRSVRHAVRIEWWAVLGIEPVGLPCETGVGAYKSTICETRPLLQQALGIT